MADKNAQNLTKEDQRFIEEHEDELSETTVKRAKWIHSRDERADRDGQTLATRSHEVIQAWAEERNAVPATVPGTEHEDRPGVLRFIFNDGENSRLEEIPWEAWFETFDERELVFLYQERKANGDQSNFFRFDSPHREDG